MFHLSHWMYALTAFYTGFAAVMVHRLRKPTCRICLYRHDCPNRPDGFPDPTRKPCYEHETPAVRN